MSCLQLKERKDCGKDEGEPQPCVLKLSVQRGQGPGVSVAPATASKPLLQAHLSSSSHRVHPGGIPHLSQDTSQYQASTAQLGIQSDSPGSCVPGSLLGPGDSETASQCGL